MRALILSATLAFTVHCGLSATSAAAAPPAATSERIATDTPKTTVAGNTFIAPAGWSLLVRGAATILEVPEGGSFIALIDIASKDAADADAAVAAGWAVYEPDA